MIISVFFQIPFALTVLFHPFIFSLCISLEVKLVSSKQHMVVSCVFYLFSHSRSSFFVVVVVVVVL
jgi:hypothetical protein